MLNPKTESNTLPQTNKLKELREQRGLSIEQLEEKSGVNRHVLRRIEHNRTKRVYAIDITRLLCFFDLKYTDMFYESI